MQGSIKAEISHGHFKVHVYVLALNQNTPSSVLPLYLPELNLKPIKERRAKSRITISQTHMTSGGFESLQHLAAPAGRHMAC